MNSYDYTKLKTHYSLENGVIVEWNKDADNVAYRNLDNVVKILNEKEARIQSLDYDRVMFHNLFKEYKKTLDAISEALLPYLQKEMINELLAVIGQCNDLNELKSRIEKLDK